MKMKIEGTDLERNTENKKQSFRIKNRGGVLKKYKEYKRYWVKNSDRNRTQQCKCSRYVQTRD